MPFGFLFFAKSIAKLLSFMRKRIIFRHIRGD
nr:MAG TPA: hypothetical protein [Crassvirales sp.]